MTYDQANSLRGFRRPSFANWRGPSCWDANRAGKNRMQCRIASTPAGSLVLSAHRWAEMLVSGRKQSVEIIVGVASAAFSAGAFQREPGAPGRGNATRKANYQRKF